MLTRIRPRAVIDLARRDIPGPVDVINLITTERFEPYRWYALLVAPALALAGGRVLWMGRFADSLHGERQADKLLIVRYPSHRRFLAMTLNPYYLAINKLREAGISRFEASFTRASRSAGALHRERSLVAVHFNSPPGEDALTAVEALVAPVAGPLVYATSTVATLGFLDPPRATDPNPLTLRELALFAPPGSDAGGLGDLQELATELAALTDGASLQVYRREPRSVYRPTLGGAPRTADAAAA